MFTNSKKILFLILILSYTKSDYALSNQYEGTPFVTSEYFYFGAKIGNIRYQHGCQDWAISCDKRDNVIGLFAGHQFNKYFAVEFGYADLGEVKANYNEYGSVNSYRATMNGFDFGFLALYPISTEFSVFAKAGVLRWYGENKGPFNTVKSNDWSTTGNVGFQYHLNESWRARLSYQIIDDLGNDELGSSNAHIAWLSISYKMGQNPPHYRVSQTSKPINQHNISKSPMATNTQPILNKISSPISQRSSNEKIAVSDNLDRQHRQKNSRETSTVISPQIEIK
ncbi:outer membrane beta-barrel protein [Colwelliaceae bacterium BS250]